MTTALPTVSVIMTVYDAERYVGAAVESILAQTYDDFEFIIIDDGSRDRSPTILQRLSERDERIHLVSRANTGICPARNEALALARGELVAILDADDIALRERLSTQVEFFRTHDSVVCAGGWFEVIDWAGRMLTVLKPPTGDAEIQEQLLQGHTAICQPACMFRREASARIGGFDESMSSSEDLDFFLRLGEIGTLANIPKCLVRYRIHGASTSATARMEMYEHARAACARAWQRRGTSGTFEPADPWRPDDTRRSRFEWTMKCGWWAFMSGQRRTATLYGMKAVALMPHRSKGWRLLACCAVKPRGG